MVALTGIEPVPGFTGYQSGSKHIRVKRRT
jgi:hypothetical protein